MQGLAGKAPRAVCFALQKDMGSDAYRERVAAFAKALARSIAVDAATTAPSPAKAA